MEDVGFSISSQITTCPKCRTELELDPADIANRKYTCPECGAKVRIKDTSIAKQAIRMVQEGKIPLSLGRRLSLWYWPIALAVPFVILLVQTSTSDPFLIALSSIVFAFALFDAYRALISDRLTFVPSAQPITQKVLVVTKIQEKLHWTVSEGKDGVFIFADKKGLCPSQSSPDLYREGVLHQLHGLGRTRPQRGKHSRHERNHEGNREILGGW